MSINDNFIVNHNAAEKQKTNLQQNNSQSKSKKNIGVNYGKKNLNNLSNIGNTVNILSSLNNNIFYNKITKPQQN